MHIVFDDHNAVEAIIWLKYRYIIGTENDYEL